MKCTYNNGNVVEFVYYGIFDGSKLNFIKSLIGKVIDESMKMLCKMKACERGVAIYLLFSNSVIN